MIVEINGLEVGTIELEMSDTPASIEARAREATGVPADCEVSLDIPETIGFIVPEQPEETRMSTEQRLERLEYQVGALVGNQQHYGDNIQLDYSLSKAARMKHCVMKAEAELRDAEQKVEYLQENLSDAEERQNGNDNQVVR